jgi:hypothetical protein
MMALIARKASDRKRVREDERDRLRMTKNPMTTPSPRYPSPIIDVSPSPPAVIAQKSRHLRRRIGHNIRSTRKTARLTLKMASERASIHWRHWQKLEAGVINLSLRTLCQVSSALSVDTATLFDAPKEEPSPSG